MTICLTVRRFRCDSPDCGRRTFAEQVEGLTFRYGRRSTLQEAMLEAVGRVLAGRAGARLARMLHCPVSPNTLLSRVRALPAEPPAASPRVLGVDDFALRRGHVYGTVLTDIETGRVVDVLPDRTSETFTARLRKHPGTEIVCRDRASAYAEAVRIAAPHAVQVADRFHLWQNLCKTVEKCVVAHRRCLVPPEGEDQDVVVEPPAGPPAIEGKRAANTRRHFPAVHEMYDKGVAIEVISKTLRMDRRYAEAIRTSRRAACPALAGSDVRPHLVGEFVHLLRTRQCRPDDDEVLLHRLLTLVNDVSLLTSITATRMHSYAERARLSFGEVEQLKPLGGVAGDARPLARQVQTHFHHLAPVRKVDFRRSFLPDVDRHRNASGVSAGHHHRELPRVCQISITQRGDQPIESFVSP